MIDFLGDMVEKIIKWWKDKQFRKKILAYKRKLNEKKESRKTK
jgi:hypothetical protein